LVAAVIPSRLAAKLFGGSKVSNLILEWQTNGKTRTKMIGGGREVTIGRHPACDIILGDPHVSRKHAAIFYQDGHFHIQNLSQTNPVVINDRWVLANDLESDLKPGDSITLGLVRLKITLNKLTASLTGNLSGTGSIAGMMAV
jgi:predicted component of type VI protein secretion system